MFGKLFKKESEPSRISLIFDIGTDSVAGAIVRFSGNRTDAPLVLYSKRVHWHNKGQSSYDQIMRAMGYTLGNVARDLQDSYPSIIHPEDIHVTLSAPWFAQEFRHAHMTRNTLFTVTDHILKDIEDKEYKMFLGDSALLEQGSFETLERTILDVSINGYSTDKPVGKKTKSIDLSISISIAPKAVLELVQDSIGRVFHSNITFHTSTLIFYAVSRDYFAKEKNYLFIDVGGELTDILVVKDEKIFQSLSFPLGTQFLYSNIANTLNTSVDEVSSLLRESVFSSLHTDMRSQITLAKKKSADLYAKHLEGALRQLFAFHPLPEVCYIAGYASFEKDMTVVFEKERYGEYTSIGTPFTVHPLTSRDIQRFIRLQPGVSHDLFIGVSVLYNNNF